MRTREPPSWIRITFTSRHVWRCSRDSRQTGFRTVLVLHCRKMYTHKHTSPLGPSVVHRVHSGRVADTHRTQHQGLHRHRSQLATIGVAPVLPTCRTRKCNHSRLILTTREIEWHPSKGHPDSPARRGRSLHDSIRINPSGHHLQHTEACPPLPEAHMPVWHRSSILNSIPFNSLHRSGLRSKDRRSRVVAMGSSRIAVHLSPTTCPDQHLTHQCHPTPVSRNRRLSFVRW